VPDNFAAGTHIFIASSAESSVIALDTCDSTANWRAFASAPVRIAPTFESGKVYFGSDDGSARCVSATDGSNIWTYRANSSKKLIPNDSRFISLYPCRTRVMVQNGRAYAGFGLAPWEASYLSCVDADSGSEQYKTTLSLGNTLSAIVCHSDAHAVLATPSTYHFLVKDKIRAVSRSNGATQWLAILEGANTLAMGGTTLFVGGSNRITAVDSSNGNRLWSSAVKGEDHSIAIANGKVFASTSTGKIYCFE
jgi:outer membrane protein assembly factor BamB